MKDTQKQRLLSYIKFVLPTLENNSNEKGYLRVHNPNTIINGKEFSGRKFFNTYNEFVELIDKYKYNQCYVGLATTNGEGYKYENLINRNTILIDIDEEDLNIEDIYSSCKKNQIFAHMVVNSGRGWHIYLKLDKNYPITDIVAVNKQLVDLFKADTNAIKTTQIIRVPFTKNFKVDKLSSMVNSNSEIVPYSLDQLKNHKIVEFKNEDTELQFEKIEDLYCFNNLIKHGISKGQRNKALIFIATTCKYANLSEVEALQYAHEFNLNCKEPQRKGEVIKTIRSIYMNTSIIKPCKMEFGQTLCSNQCKCKSISNEDIFTKSNIEIDNKVVGLTNSHIIAKDKNREGVKKHMLECLNGTDLMIIATLKVCNTKMFTIEDLIEFLEISKPTIKKSLDFLEGKNIVVATKQHINKSAKPTNLYTYNLEFEKYNKEIVHLNTNLFTARIRKAIKDNDLKVAIAIRYLMSNKMSVTLEDIEYISGVDKKNISRNLTKLEKEKLLIKDKVRTEKGYCNNYQLFF